MSNHIILSCENLGKAYKDGDLQVKVFENLNCEIQQGEQVAIIGRSGAGKSTLLHLLGGLDKPTTGTVIIDGEDINKLSENKRAQLRNQKLGFIYQLHHLLPEFTVLENVAMPMLLSNMSVHEINTRALSLLDAVGLADRVNHRIGELSGGERQRTAIVRALINHPKCVLADEPTGNLDQATANTVYDTMLRMNRSAGTTFVIVTHDHEIAKRMDRVLSLEQGKLVTFNG